MGNTTNVDLSSWKDFAFKDGDMSLKENQHYKFNSISISNSSIERAQQGIFIISCKNDIILSKVTVNLTGMTNWNDAGKLNMNAISQNTELKAFYGKSFHQVFVGAQGRDGDSCSGGHGGNGLIIRCDGSLILKNECLIDVSGTDCCTNGAWFCGLGSGGSILIDCKQIIMDDRSKIIAKLAKRTARKYRISADENKNKNKNKSSKGGNDEVEFEETKHIMKKTVNGDGRIVIRSDRFALISKQNKLLLCNGFIRQIDYNFLIKDIVNLCIKYCFVDIDCEKLNNYFIAPEPIIVDSEWKQCTLQVLNHDQVSNNSNNSNSNGITQMIDSAKKIATKITNWF